MGKTRIFLYGTLGLS